MLPFPPRIHDQAMANVFLVSALITVFFLASCFSNFAQQGYVGKATTDCGNTGNPSVLGNVCNGVRRSCQAYLTFRSQTPYTSVSSISSLLRSDPAQVSAVNSVSENTTLETNREVMVPVNCSCSGGYYQSNTSYVVTVGTTYLSIANNTFQALSTCQALQAQNDVPAQNLDVGTRINVPLRCACPTKNQTDVGVRYLLSYLVSQGDTVLAISERFGAEAGRISEANGLSLENPTIYFFTTLLIPLQNRPSSSQTLIPPPPPPSVPPLPPPPPAPGSSKKTWVYILAGIIGGVALLLTVLAIVFYCTLFRKRKTKNDPVVASSGSLESREKALKKMKAEEPREFIESLSSIAPSLKVYNFQELQFATDNFSPVCFVKGSVFRGMINGDWAAIKMTNGDVSNEIKLLNQVNHSNLIRLSGICFHDAHWYLVYEYAQNGSLHDWIHNNSNQSLSWTQRIQIACDVAAGLNYLHSYTSPPHVHKDLKSSNVLLDANFRAKITNFVLARSAEGKDGQFALTRHIVGTKGYMAPEYLEHGLVSPKLDVYAFGVIMLELLTGKDADGLHGNEMKDLSEVCREHDDGIGKQRLRDLLDPALHGQYPSELAIFIVRLVDGCLKKDPAVRPGMEELVRSLSRILTTSVNCDQSSSF